MNKRRAIISGTIFLTLASIAGIFTACGIHDGPSLKSSSQSQGSVRSVLSPVPVTCDPAGSPFGGGDGTTTPFAICTIAQLNQISSYAGSLFILAADLDMTSSSYTAQTLDGTLDGNRHQISNLTMSGPGQQSLFDTINSGSVVKNLGLTNIHIDAVLGSSFDGGAAFTYLNNGMISGCYAKGQLTATGTPVRLAGLVISNNGLIENSYAAVTLISHSGYATMGGLVSQQYSPGTITNSFAATSFTSGASDTVGGLVADSSGSTSTGSFWDSTVSSVSTTAESGNSVPETTSNMQSMSIYASANWDFTVWYVSNGSYPKFVWEP